MRSQGYRVVLFFLWLPIADLAVARVANRVRQGGHDVPEADVRRRFHAGLRNLGLLYRSIADDWWLLGPWHLHPMEIARHENGVLLVTEPTFYHGFQTEIQESSNHPIMQVTTSEFSESDKVRAALHLASWKALEIARQTQTPIVVWQDGKIKEIPWDQIESVPFR